MASRQVILSVTAYADLEAIESYIAEDSQIIAQEFINRILSKLEQLYTHPEPGKKVPEFNDNRIRELLIKKYRIIYQILNQREIVVLRVVHGSRLLDLEE